MPEKILFAIPVLIFSYITMNSFFYELKENNYRLKQEMKENNYQLKQEMEENNYQLKQEFIDDSEQKMDRFIDKIKHEIVMERYK